MKVPVKKNLEARVAARVGADDLKILRDAGADVSEIVRRAIKSAADTLRTGPVAKV